MDVPERDVASDPFKAAEQESWQLSTIRREYRKIEEKSRNFSAGIEGESQRWWKQQQKKKTEKQQKWQMAYKESLEKHGSVLVEVTQCIFVGTPAVGKSSLKHFLVHDMPKEVKASTAVMDTPEVVTISSEQYAVEGCTSAWQPVSSEVMEKSLQACVTEKEYEEGQYPELHRCEDKQSNAEVENGDTPHPPSSQKLIRRLSKLFRRTSRASAAHQSVAHNYGRKEATVGSEIATSLDQEHSMFVQGLGTPGQSIKLKDASFVHLLDTGGQPSFQDTLPLLLDAPCTYIQVFNAAHNLDQPVPITYRPDDHTEESLPPSMETGWEMMLRSFSSMHTMACKIAKELATFQQEGSHLPQQRIFVVGTFKDQLVQKGKLKEATRDISKRLKELEGKPYYYYIEKDVGGQPFYLISNLAKKEEDRAHVNSLRKHLSASRSSFKLKVPLMWYICEQITRRTAQKFIRFHDLKTFCLKHEFIDANGADEQFRSLLKLFSLLGFYSFFDLNDVPEKANYVCTDRGVFLKEVSKLLAVQFLGAPRCHAVEVFKRDGIISSSDDIFDELGIKEDVNRRWFLATLEHVGLLAHYTSATNHSASYFMPIVLPQGKMKLPSCSSIAPLCITFTFHSPDNPLVYSDLPRGVFCRLAVELSSGPWIPIPEESDRNTVKFYTERFELYLTEAPGFISLTPVLVEELEGEEPLAELHKLCQQLYGVLHRSVVPAAEDVLGEQFTQTTKIVFGFKCCCKQVPHLVIPASAEGKSLICLASKTRRKSLSKERIWFSPVDGAELVEVNVSGCNVWVMKEAGGPASDLPPLGHLQQKVHAQQSVASSKDRPTLYEQDIMSLRIAGIRHYEKLLRTHVAPHVGKHGHSLLIMLGLSDAEIQMLHNDNPHNYVNAIHSGLLKFKDRGGTWGELIEGMKEAGIGLEYIEALNEGLTQQ